MISFVIVNYNAGLFLSECVQAVLPQVIEVLVVDNASTDTSLSLCSKQFPDAQKLKVILNSANLGFAAACNIGGKHPTGDYVFLINRIAVWIPLQCPS